MRQVFDLLLHHDFDQVAIGVGDHADHCAATNCLKRALPAIEAADRIFAKRLEPGCPALISSVDAALAPCFAAASDLLLAGDREIVAHHVGDLLPGQLVVAGRHKNRIRKTGRAFRVPRANRTATKSSRPAQCSRGGLPARVWCRVGKPSPVPERSPAGRSCPARGPMCQTSARAASRDAGQCNPAMA